MLALLYGAQRGDGLVAADECQRRQGDAGEFVFVLCARTFEHILKEGDGFGAGDECGSEDVAHIKRGRSGGRKFGLERGFERREGFVRAADLRRGGASHECDRESDQPCHGIPPMRLA